MGDSWEINCSHEKEPELFLAGNYLDCGLEAIDLRALNMTISRGQDALSIVSQPLTLILANKRDNSKSVLQDKKIRRGNTYVPSHSTSGLAYVKVILVPTTRPSRLTHLARLSSTGSCRCSVKHLHEVIETH